MNLRSKRANTVLPGDLAIRNILSGVNWSFSTPFSVGRSGIDLFDARKHHWYPATFIPELPHTLIEVLSAPGEVVYDPFSGIGTTIFQALHLGRVPYGTEVCRVAVNVIHSIWTLLSPAINLSRVAVQTEQVLTVFDERRSYEKDIDKSTIRKDELRAWFNEKTFNRLCYLFAAEATCRDRGTRAALRIAISATLKAVCAQDKGWGCIADNVRPSEAQLSEVRDPLSRVRRNVNVLLRAVEAFRRSLPPASNEFLGDAKPSEHIVHGDTRTVDLGLNGSVNLIVTSPPYPNMTDYATSQRLSYYWMGADPNDDLPTEIGARRRRRAPGSIEQYKGSMEEVMSGFRAKLRRRGYVCLVLPKFDADNENNVVRRGVIEDGLQYLVESGFELKHELQRLLPERRRHHNQGWTSLERENIYVFQKL